MLLKSLLSSLLICVASFALFLSSAWGDFVIEFTDGRQVVVRQYTDQGQTILVYTSYGTIGFRKEDIRRISEANAEQSGIIPIGTMNSRPPSRVNVGEKSASREKQAAVRGPGAAKMKQNHPSQQVTDKKTALAQIEKRYTVVAAEISTLWEKHMRDVDAGASEETLAENRRRLNALGQERYTVLEAVREATLHDLPEWAR